MEAEFILPDEDDAPWLDCMDGFKASIENEEPPVPTEPMTNLRTLDDHNRSALEAFTPSSGPCPNGIACPECGQELVDSNPSVCLTSWPPQYSVHCPACGYSGYRR